ncbi:MAG: TIGR03768 family metallophosphoesterase [bacterium]
MKKKIEIVTVTFLIFIYIVGCNNNGVSDNSPISTSVPTTLESTVIPVTALYYPPGIKPNEVGKYSSLGFGNWYYGPGIPYQKRLDIMPSTYLNTSVTNSSYLLHFFTMTDIHLQDIQTPAQRLYEGLENTGTMSGYTPSMLLTPQFFDAAIRTVNSLNEKKRFDFGIFLGDAINNAQYNEVRMYIDILDGKVINPNSDPLLTAATDYMLPFQSAGLNKSIPWYQVIGNHDHFWSGSFTPNNYMLQSMIGSNVLNVGNILHGENLDSRGRYMGVIDGSTEYGVVKYAGLTEEFSEPPQVNANPDRRFINKTGFINEFFNTNSSPVGHGFANSTVPGCYTFEPKANLPLKIIVLNDTQEEDCAVGHGSIASLNTERYTWLVNELDKGQNEKKLMIIAAHIPIGISPYLFDNASTPSQTDLIAKLHTYSNLILWISGHVHRNMVTPMPSTDISHPEFGFWLVETSSLRDFPQMFRLFDIVRNSDNTISIFATNVNPYAPSGSLAAKSRSYAIAAQQVFTHFDVQPIYVPTGAYNAELVKLLSPEMQDVIKNY